MVDGVNSILTVSDVSVGYGTPQVLSISRSLMEHLGAECLVLEPDQPERPPLPNATPRMKIDRVYTANHPYTLSGQAEYCMQVADRINSERPDCVILCSFLGTGALLRMKHRPKLLIYYGLEHTDGDRMREKEMFTLIADKVDLAIFPEENRARLDAPRLGLESIPSVIAYNGSAHEVQPRPWNKRNDRFFYGGLLHPDLTYGDYFLRGGLDMFPIDLFGLTDGYSDVDGVLADLSERNSRVSYNGYAPGGSAFLEMLRDYLFSIVIWAPTRESTLYAAPNKFFDAIQAGVPPLCAPHPMCQSLISRYKCGVLMKGWDLIDVQEALASASRILFSGEYAEMVEERLPQARAELSWDRQFEKIAASVDAILASRRDRGKHRTPRPSAAI